MLKRVAGILTLFIVVLTLAGLFCSLVSAAENRQYIFDESGKFTQEQYDSLTKKAAEFSEKSSAYFLASVNDGYIINGDIFCSKNKISTSQNIILLIITLKSGEINYDIYTYGDAYSKISDKEIDRILDADEVYDNIKSAKFYEGTNAFFDKSVKAYNGLLWASPSVPVITGIVLTALIFVITTVCIIFSYKKKMRSTNYPLERYTTLNMRETDDVFLGSTVTKVRINSGNSSGGGHSIGGGVGSGGGHRGGR